jgi:hypothetical protein
MYSIYTHVYFFTFIHMLRIGTCISKRTHTVYVYTYKYIYIYKINKKERKHS